LGLLRKSVGRLYMAQSKHANHTGVSDSMNIGIVLVRV
jgi:hypothetical protein